MKVFEIPEIEVQMLSVCDVITTSGEGENQLPIVPVP